MEGDETRGEEGAVEGEGEADRERDWGGDEGIMGLGCRWRCREGGGIDLKRIFFSPFGSTGTQGRDWEGQAR